MFLLLFVHCQTSGICSWVSPMTFYIASPACSLCSQQLLCKEQVPSQYLLGCVSLKDHYTMKNRHKLQRPDKWLLLLSSFYFIHTIKSLMHRIIAVFCVEQITFFFCSVVVVVVGGFVACLFCQLDGQLFWIPFPEEPFPSWQGPPLLSSSERVFEHQGLLLGCHMHSVVLCLSLLKNSSDVSITTLRENDLTPETERERERLLS